jgi:hypothetical protein
MQAQRHRLTENGFRQENLLRARAVTSVGPLGVLSIGAYVILTKASVDLYSRSPNPRDTD